jgi:serine/threonine protein kinase
MSDEGVKDGLLGGDIVFAPARARTDGEPGKDARSAGLPNARRSRILALANGRRSVRDILRLSPFPKDETLQHLRELSERGALEPIAGQEAKPAPKVVVIDARPRGVTPSVGVAAIGVPVPEAARQRPPTGSNMIVIDTRHRDNQPRTDAPPAVAAAPSAVQVWAASGPTTAPVVASRAAAPAAAGPSSGLPRIGNYEVAARIAQGGMGSVYACRRVGVRGLEHLYTLKVVRQYSAEQGLAESSLRREARVGAWLRHPNIHSVVDSGTHKDQPYVILDYVEGVSLEDVLAGGRRPPAPIIASIVLDALRALEKVHGVVDEAGRPRGLVHSDVSPPNILVGTDGVSRLTDFGSCRVLSEEGPNGPEPVKMGKPSYMAPEQLHADTLDSRTDLFALGVVLYAALTGQDLFGAETYAEVVLNVLKKRIPPASENGAPACFDELVRRALSRSREGRFATATEMAQALVAAASSHNVLASPAEVGAYIRREFGEVLDERRRRIQRAIEGESTSRVTTWKLDLSEGGAEKKNIPTLFIPAQGGDDERHGDAGGDRALVVREKEAPRAVREGRRSSSSSVRVARPKEDQLKTILRLLAKEKGAIALSVAACTIVIVVLALLGQRGSAAPKQSARPAGQQATSGTASNSPAKTPSP